MSMDASSILANTNDPGRDVAARISQWCRQYDHKTLARMFGVEPRTAKSWRAGQMPLGKHLALMVGQWGEAFLQDVFAPVLAETDDQLDRRLERLEREIQSIRRHANADGQASARTDSDDRGRAVRLRRKVAHTAAVILCFVATGVASIATDEIRTPQGRYGGRPPVVRSVREG